MKKNILITLMALSFGSFLFSATVTPTISMRFNDIVGEDIDPEDCEEILEGNLFDF